jgi:crotonobetainyl-CoA:carnitine CoA-transferase CaiB-like acyl-CoA transferase
MGALSHLTVLEIGSGVPVAYAGRCLADLGAAVTKIEPPAGDPTRAWPPFLDDQPGPTRSAVFAYTNVNKRSVVVDATSTRGAEVCRRLMETVDIVLQNGPPGQLVDWEISLPALRAVNDALIVTTVTPFGLQGPRANWRATDLTIYAAAGLAKATPAVVEDPNETPPLRPGGRQADYVTGMSAATATMLAVHQRRQTGRGLDVTVSAQAALAAFMRMTTAYRGYDPENRVSVVNPVNSRRGKPATLWGLVPCRDGYFAFQATEQYQWDGLMRALGDPDWARRPEFQDPYERMARWEEIDPLLQEVTLQRTKAEIYHAAQAERVPVFPCYDIAEVCQDEQVRSRSFLTTISRDDVGDVTMPGAAVRHSRTPVEIQRSWPALGEHTDQVLEPILGADELATLKSEGVLG